MHISHSADPAEWTVLSLLSSGRQVGLPFPSKDGGGTTKRGRRHRVILSTLSSGREFYFVQAVKARTVSDNPEKGRVQGRGNYTQIQALSTSARKTKSWIPQYMLWMTDNCFRKHHLSFSYLDSLPASILSMARTKDGWTPAMPAYLRWDTTKWWK